MSEREWTGNILTRIGATLVMENVTGTLMKVDPLSFALPHGFRPKWIGRLWILNIDRNKRMRIGSGPSCVSCVLLKDLMPEPAKREAELILDWANEYYEPSEIEASK